MSLQVIEGTWEEVKRHEAELTGRHVRLTVTPEKATTNKPRTPTIPTTKVLRARGAFKGMFGGTAALLAEKQVEIELEERNF